jgi:hypothetical protein
MMNLFMRTRNGPSDDAAAVDEKTVKRAKKYVARLNYLHFSQFARPLETMPISNYVAIMGSEAARL